MTSTSDATVVVRAEMPVISCRIMSGRSGVVAAWTALTAGGGLPAGGGCMAGAGWTTGG